MVGNKVLRRELEPATAATLTSAASAAKVYLSDVTLLWRRSGLLGSKHGITRQLLVECSLSVKHQPIEMCLRLFSCFLRNP